MLATLKRLPRRGQASDIDQVESLLADHTPNVVIADRGSDRKGLVEEVEPHLYRERNPGKRVRAKAKPFRRVATSYEKKAVNDLAFAWLAAWTVTLK